MRIPGGVYVLALVAAAPAAHADPVYIIEQLVVNVVSGPEGGGERVATVKSGDRLELLDRQGEQSHVKLANGAEGWIRSSYLSVDPPLTVRLTERTAEVAKLQQAVSKLESELAAARAAAAAAQAATGTQPASSQSPPSEGGPVERDASPLLAPAPTPLHSAWEWVLGASAITLPAGFALGWQVLARRIRRKFGGLRIY
ncbi:MAG TPA: TIGR04211 family SH3 domain-containing protein [Steroidobacteraceae bacterium]|nr:TIGR04211 family SH3 domain-containing protein [Steroidobacteraceae bacterium]